MPATLAPASERPASFDARLTAYLPGLYKLARRLTREPEDLVSETVEWALAKWHLYRTNGGFWSWLSFGMRMLHGDKLRRPKGPPLVAVETLPAISVEASQDYAADIEGVLSKVEGRTRDIVIRTAKGEGTTEIGQAHGISRTRVTQILQGMRSELRLEPRRVHLHA